MYTNAAGALTMPGVILAGDYLWFVNPVVIFNDETISNGGKSSSSVSTTYQGVHIFITVKTTRSCYHLAHRLGVEMPILEQMYQVLYNGKRCEDAVRELFQRGLKKENG